MIRLENVLKTSWSCPEDVLKTSLRCLEDVLKTFWRYLEEVFARRLEDVLKTSWQDVSKTFWKRLEDVWLRRVYWSWSRCLQNVLKTSSEDVWVKWIYSSWWQRLEDVLKTSPENEDERRLQGVFKTSSSRWMFAGKSCRHRFCMAPRDFISTPWYFGWNIFHL